MKIQLYRLLAITVLGCGFNSEVKAQTSPAVPLQKTIHVFVALCDNDSQGIVPVPKMLGNGDDPKNNLYWGAMYGTKAFFKRSHAWELVTKVNNVNGKILERAVFKHRATNTYVVADAYRGTKIKEAVESFLDAAAGNRPMALKMGDTELGIYGNAHLVAYIGHNGLMDFHVDCPEPNLQRNHNTAAIVLACKSKPYFLPLLEKFDCQPLLLTTGFMAPEAYTLEAAVEAWIAGKPANDIRSAAAKAYDKYQKCGINGATRLFYSEQK